MIKKLNSGDRQISASSFNEVRQFVNEFSSGQNTVMVPQSNPVYVTVHNTHTDPLPEYSIVKIVEGSYPDREVDEGTDEALNIGVELDVIVPDNRNNTVAILQEAIDADGYGKAIVSGCSACRLWLDDDEETYDYAEPYEGLQTGLEYYYTHLHATKLATNIRVLWHAESDGTTNSVLAYVCIGIFAERPIILDSSLLSDSPEQPCDDNSYTLYQSSSTSFGRENHTEIDAVNNPLGLPADRPWAIAKVNGFPNRINGIPEYTAIGCDCREFFTIPASSSSNINTGDVYNIGHGSSSATSNAWVPTANVGGRIAVSQIKTPAGFNKAVRVPFYCPESNIGYEPKRASNVLDGCRCGVASNEHQFTLNRFDYLYINGKYVYEPVFILTTQAVAGSGSGVYVTINGSNYQVTFRSSFQYPNIAVPDIYAGDEITVRINASGSTPVITPVTYPTDYATGTIIGGFQSPGRGWEDYDDWKTTSGDFVQVLNASSNFVMIPKTISGASVIDNYDVNIAGVKFWIKTRTDSLLDW